MNPLSRRIPAVVLCLALAVTLSAQAPPAASPAAPPDIDAWVARAMKIFDVPGLGLAIVKDGQIVLAKGYGVRKLGAPEPVDGKTLFGVASNTKVFTAAALGLLVEEGKVEWDAPVVRYLPAFQLWDPYVTRELTVRDLLVHRSRLGARRGRPALVAAVHVQPGGDRAPAALHQADDQLPQRVRLRQRPVPRCRPAD